MADPVSWLLIRPGWGVVSSDGLAVGSVEQVVGDETRDIFDGLAIAAGGHGPRRYVPAEQVAAIEEGVVHLSLTAEQCASLAEYHEPPPVVEVDPLPPVSLWRKLVDGIGRVGRPRS